MTVLDLVILALLAGSLYVGYRRGAVVQVMGVGGLVIGVAAGMLLAPRLAASADSLPTAVAFGLGIVLVAGAIGNMVGYVAGSSIRHKTHGTPLRRADALGGSLLSAAALLAVTWFVTLNLSEGPFPVVARGLRRSAIVRTLDSTLPPPPSLVGEASRFFSLLGFSGVTDALGEPVPLPSQARAAAAARNARGSTVEVTGRGCYRWYVTQGSGFVVRPDLVITNAHVVAGTTGQRIWVEGRGLAATVVRFDPDLDVALLHVPGLGLPPLALATDEAGRFDVGAVIGYPDGGPLDVRAAAVRDVGDPVGRDIYDREPVRRRLYELQASIHHGNSGGPFVLEDGSVAGMVFASAEQDPEVGYAIAASELAPLVADTATTRAVGTGSCAG
jgi:S1-C subfamily serine protease